MLYLEIQKGKEAMNELAFQPQIRGTGACMKIIMKSTKGCGQLSSNETFFSDSWFSGVKIVEDANAEGVDFCGPVKKIHKEFCLSALENLMK